MEVQCSNDVVRNNVHDALFEILLRVNPYDIFNCILVCKDWLFVITNPIFRANHINVWKNSSSIVLGFYMFDLYKIMNLTGREVEGKEAVTLTNVQLLPTSKMGRSIKARTLMSGRGWFFISKSSKGGLLLLGKLVFDDPNRFSRRVFPKRLFGGVFSDRFFRSGLTIKYYVFNPISRGRPIKLPPPPTNYEKCIANVLCNDDDGKKFKVVLAKSGEDDDEEDDEEDNKVSMQIYCSRTRKWEEQTTPSCSTSFCLSTSAIVDPGIVSSGGGTVYWRVIKENSRFVAWDINKSSISFIPVEKKFGLQVNYGVSPHPWGSLLAASIHYSFDVVFDWESDLFAIKIWAFDDDKRVWYLLNSVSQDSIWTNNLSLLTSLFEVRPVDNWFRVVSFFPRKTDSIFVKMCKYLFIYHFQSGKLERLEYPDDMVDTFSKYADVIEHHPLTMLDLRGPSFPPSLRLSHCSSS